MVRSWEWFVPPVGTTQLLEEQEEGLSVKLHDKDDESSEETTETTMTPAVSIDLLYCDSTAFDADSML
jgi:hypothetical protein